MEKQKHTIEYIKRQAKNLKRDLNISHTQALERVAVANGYSNWQHCQRSISQISENVINLLVETPEITFTEWLIKHKNRKSPLGDLARDVFSDIEWPSSNRLEDYRNYLNRLGACIGAVGALEASWKSYTSYLRRKKNPKINSVKKTIEQKELPRRIVFVKNTTKIPFNKRTVEKFNIGDLAWISWNGRKAIPVIVLEVNETHYTIKQERPLNKSTNNFLFLDEVRSTPESACKNAVTS